MRTSAHWRRRLALAGLAPRGQQTEPLARHGRQVIATPPGVDRPVVGGLRIPKLAPPKGRVLAAVLADAKTNRRIVKLARSQIP